MGVELIAGGPGVSAFATDRLGTAEGWDTVAACRGEDPSLFFGPNRFEPKRERVAREASAKEVCASCPVLGPCREYALTTSELFGVWGGLGEAERRTLIERATAAPAKRAG